MPPQIYIDRDLLNSFQRAAFDQQAQLTQEAVASNTKQIDDLRAQDPGPTGTMPPPAQPAQPPVVADQSDRAAASLSPAPAPAQPSTDTTAPAGSPSPLTLPPIEHFATAAGLSPSDLAGPAPAASTSSFTLPSLDDLMKQAGLTPPGTTTGSSSTPPAASTSSTPTSDTSSGSGTSLLPDLQDLANRAGIGDAINSVRGAATTTVQTVGNAASGAADAAGNLALPPLHEIAKAAGLVSPDTPPPSASSMAPPPQMPDVHIDSSSPEAFIRSITPAAEYVSAQTGIPAPAMIAMAANETGYGQYAAGNNLFGIKGQGPAGSTNAQTWEDYGGGAVTIRDNFRAYDNPTQSFQDFANLITNSPRYAAALGQKTVEGFVTALKNGGYMTDPNYVSKIVKIADQFAPTIQQAAAAVVPSAPTPASSTQAAPSGRPSQFALGLSDADAYAACGPTAAIAFAQAYGRNPTADEAMDLAKASGWTERGGMNGVANEQALLGKLGVPARLETNVDWSHVAQDAASGNPVIISTPGHYYIVDGYNAQTGQFHEATQAERDLKGGAEWMTADRMQALMGKANGALYADNPNSPAPSVANTQPSSSDTTNSAWDDLAQRGAALADQGANLVKASSQTVSSAADAVQKEADQRWQDLQATISNSTQALLQRGQDLLKATLPTDVNAAADHAEQLASQYGQNDDRIASLESQPDRSPSDLAQLAALRAQQTSLMSTASALNQQAQSNPSSSAGGPGTPPPPDQNADKPIWQKVSDGIGQALKPLFDALGNAGQTAPLEGGGYGSTFANESNPTAALNTSANQAAQAVTGAVSNIGAEPTDPEWVAWKTAHPDDFARLYPQWANPAPDITDPHLIGKVTGVDPLGGLQQGPANVVGGVQNRDFGQVVGGTLQTVGAITGALPAGASASGGLADVASSAAEAASNPAVQDAITAALRSRLPGEAEAGFASGADALAALMARVRAYPAEVQQGLEDFVSQATRSGQSIEDVGNTVRQWIEENPPAPASPAEQVSARIAAARNGGLPGGSETGPAIPQRGQLPLEGGLPVGGPRPPGGPDTTVATPQPGQLQFESSLPVGGPAPPAGPAEGVTGIQPGQTTPLPGFPKPSKPASILDVIGAIHSGNVVSGLSTMTHVAVNSIIAPTWANLTHTAADVVGGTAGALTGGYVGIAPGEAISRMAGRQIGWTAATANAFDDFGAAIARFYSDPANIANRVDNPALAGLLRIQQATGSALHSAFQTLAQRAVTSMELGAEAGAQASREGLTGADWVKRVGDLINDPTQGLSQRAIAKAQDVGTRAALRGDAGSLQQALQTIAKVPVAGNTLFPVVRIASQSFAQGIEKSPIGLAGTLADVGRFGLAKAGLVEPGTVMAGPYAKTAADLTGAGLSRVGGAVTPLGDRLINNIAGTVMAIGLAQKAMDGTITGNGPADPTERDMLLAKGWQPHSVFIPGLGYTDYHVLGPLAVPFSLAGNYADSKLYPNKGTDPTTGATPQEIAADLSDRVMSYLGDATGLRTLGDLYTVIHGGPQAQPIIAQVVGSTASGFVPESGLLRSVAESMDPALRKPQPGDIGQVVAQGIPGQGIGPLAGRETVPVRRDVLGRVVPNEQAGLGALLGPRGFASDVVTPTTGGDAVLNEVMRLRLAGEKIGITAPKAATYAGAGSPATETSAAVPQQTPEQQQLIQQQEGAAVKTYLANVMANPAYQNLNDAQKANALDQAMTNARRAANVTLGGDITRSPHDSALLMWSQVPHYLGVTGTPDEIAQQNFQIAEARAKAAEYRREYPGTWVTRLSRDDPQAFHLSIRQPINSLLLRKAKAAIDQQTGGELTRSMQTAAAGGLVGAGRTPAEVLAP